MQLAEHLTIFQALEFFKFFFNFFLAPEYFTNFSNFLPNCGIFLEFFFFFHFFRVSPKMFMICDFKCK